ncbi:IAA-alanine resistance protein 1 [Zea mays]|nr:IAA-alanine resistance protein 1 [Zea mays]
MAEEADLELESFGYEDHDHGHHHHHHHHHSHGDMETSPMGVWLSAMGCSLLVSMASLVCLVLLPVIFFKGKPSKAIVDSLAVFGAGAMLGDSFLHQLPHAFGGGHSHSHDHEGHDHAHAHEHAHAHSLQDLSVGLSVLFGIVLFFIVEKIVRYVEDNSQNGAHSMGHGHHHHNHKRHDSSDKAKLNYQKSDTDGKDIDHAEEEPSVNDTTGKISDGHESEATIRKRSSSKATDGEATNSGRDPAPEKAPSISNSNLVFGYLNLFSDGVHNFTDGMALGSAFLLHGSVGGWSRTLFLLAHELPQEVGDFGILVRSGFTVSKALFFNFLSALVALAGTALALSLGKDPGHSSLIEGFTAGGFIYIAVAGVLPQMNDQKTTIKSSVAQLISLAMGMLVALGISLVE